MMKVLLGREGHQVDLAANGMEALDAVKYQKYDIVFMDLQMPVMDGVNASRRIREWENGNSHTFIVALTASYMPEEGQILFEAGLDNYVSKPFEVEHIQRLLKYISDGRRIAQSVASAPAPARASGEVLNVHLGVQRVGGDRETYRELLKDFIDELPEKMIGFQRYFSAGDMPALGRAAHNLKGVSANLGALELSEYAAAVEKQCNDGYTGELKGLVLEAKHMGSRLQEAFAKFLAGANSLESV
jgi:CheY-like chemotaxis protein